MPKKRRLCDTALVIQWHFQIGPLILWVMQTGFLIKMWQMTLIYISLRLGVSGSDKLFAVKSDKCNVPLDFGSPSRPLLFCLRSAEIGSHANWWMVLSQGGIWEQIFHTSWLKWHLGLNDELLGQPLHTYVERINQERIASNILYSQEQHPLGTY